MRIFHVDTQFSVIIRTLLPGFGRQRSIIDVGPVVLLAPGAARVWWAHQLEKYPLQRNTRYNGIPDTTEYQLQSNTSYKMEYQLKRNTRYKMEYQLQRNTSYNGIPVTKWNTSYNGIPASTEYQLQRNTSYNGIPNTAEYQIQRNTRYNGIPDKTEYQIKRNTR